MGNTLTGNTVLLFGGEKEIAPHPVVMLGIGADGLPKPVAVDVEGNTDGVSAPASNAVAVTPDDSTALANPSRGLYVGTTGDVAVTMGGGGDVTFPAVPSGAILPVRVTKVKASGTTASGIVALY